MLRKENSHAIGDWIFQDILCRWGTLVEIVTDKGTPFIKALAYLEKKYHVKHIRISGYNSRANLAEHPHFDVRPSLFKKRKKFSANNFDLVHCLGDLTHTNYCKGL